MDDLFTGLALVLVIEGSLYALFPNFMRELSLKVREISPATLRTVGLVAAVAGVALVWLVRG